jgi:hypothetical protein
LRKKIVTTKNKNLETFERLNNFNYISFKIFTLDLILVFLSIINILISYYKKKNNTVHYWIIPNNENNYRDFRSEFFFSILKDKNTISLVKSSSFTKSIKCFFIFPNIIFYQSLNNVIYYLSRKKSNYTNTLFRFYYKFFLFLRIKKIVFIDDYRILPLFNEIGNQLNIHTYAYMHGRFSNKQISVKKSSFTKYIVWSNYFRKKLFHLNKYYNYSNTIICNFIIKKKIYKKNKKINTVYVCEENINYEKIKSYILEIIKNNHINLFVKEKNINTDQYLNFIKFCNEKKIKIISKNQNLREILRTKMINCVIAHSSTSLLEASMYNAAPIMVGNFTNYSNDLIKDKVVFYTNQISGFSKIIEYFSKDKKKINRIKNNVWGKNKFCDKRIMLKILNSN